MPSINPSCFEKCICSTCKQTCHKAKEDDKFCFECLDYPTCHCNGYEKMPYAKYNKKFKGIVSEETYNLKKPI